MLRYKIIGKVHFAKMNQASAETGLKLTIFPAFLRFGWAGLVCKVYFGRFDLVSLVW